MAKLLAVVFTLLSVLSLLLSLLLAAPVTVAVTTVMVTVTTTVTTTMATTTVVGGDIVAAAELMAAAVTAATESLAAAITTAAEPSWADRATGVTAILGFVLSVLALARGYRRPVPDAEPAVAAPADAAPAMDEVEDEPARRSPSPPAAPVLPALPALPALSLGMFTRNAASTSGSFGWPSAGFRRVFSGTMLEEGPADDSADEDDLD